MDNITCKLTEPKYSKMYCTLPLRSTLFTGYGTENKVCDKESQRKIINVTTGSEFPLSLITLVNKILAHKRFIVFLT